LYGLNGGFLKVKQGGGNTDSQREAKLRPPNVSYSGKLKVEVIQKSTGGEVKSQLTRKEGQKGMWLLGGNCCMKKKKKI